MSLRAKLAVLFALVAVGGVAAASLAAYASTRAQLEQEVERFLVRRADEIVQGSRLAPQGGRDNRGPTIAVEADAIVQIIEPSGTPSSSTGDALPVDAQEASIARGGGAPVEREVVVDGERYRMITRALRRDGGGAVQVARSLTEVDDVLSGLRNRLTIVGIAVASIAGCTGWLFAQRATGPLRRLADAAGEVASTGDLSTTVPIEGSDEVTQVARSFDAMLGALATSREQQRRLVEDAGHELRTPLTALRTDVALLRRAPDYEPDKREVVLVNIESEVAELADLVTELVQLATDEREDEPREAFDLADVVTEAVGRCRRRTGRDIELDAVASPVVGQPAQVERAVTNLLGNAHKFSPPGTAIEVRVADGAVTVRDHGPGIPVEERPRVTDRFYRGALARAAAGSGLGLAIVDQIVRRHGGTLSFADAPEGGAEVGFRLPRPPD